MNRNQYPEPHVDPAEEAASQAGLALAPAVAAIAARLRHAHMEQRQGESEEATRTKVTKWRAGKFCPLGGRHKPARRTT